MYGIAKLGQLLLSRNKITEAQLQRALELQATKGSKIGETLVDLGWITYDDLWQAQADQYEVEYEPLALEDWDPEIRSFVPHGIASKKFVFPVRVVGNTLRLAMAEPHDVDTIDQIRTASGLLVQPCFCPPDKILEAVASRYADELTDFDTEIEQVREIEGPEDISSAVEASSQPPVIRLVNSILHDAVEIGASDVHFEPQERCLEIRFRVDGQLHKAREVPKPIQAAALSRVKLMAEIDIAERRRAQDGRFTVRVGEHRVDVRASSLPTVNGERIVLRLLDRSAALRKLNEIDLMPEIYEPFTQLIEKPWGLTLVTGPTGSGKTTTLYAALQHIRTDAINILTCEDPVEYTIDGIGQSQVNVKAGLTFASQLRAILRQDPDVVFVGEIRDQETAEIACQAAMTGHLVLASLHTNDAVSAAPRLLDMDIQPFLLNSALIGSLAQRLVRRLCVHCREEHRSPSLAVALGLPPDTTLYRPVGCSQCKNIGYKGRIGIHELFTVTDPIRNLIGHRAGADQLRSAAPPGTLRMMVEDAARKVAAGITSAEEALATVPAVIELQAA